MQTSLLKPRKIDALKPLLLQLQALFQDESKTVPNDTPLTVDALGELLPTLLGEVAQILHPAIAETHCPLHHDPQRAAVGAIHYAQLIHSHCVTPHASRPVLLKPLLIPLFETAAAGKAIAWKLLVILPPAYQAPYGEISRLQAPRFYWFDPMAKQAVDYLPSSCVALYRILREGCQQIVEIQAKKVRLQVNPAFPQARFYNGSEAQAQTVVDSGYWIVYAACLTVLTGSPPHRLTVPLKDRWPAYRLRALFTLLPTPLVATESKVVQPTQRAVEAKEVPQPPSAPAAASRVSQEVSPTASLPSSPVLAPVTPPSASPLGIEDKKPPPVSAPTSSASPPPFPSDNPKERAEAKQEQAQPTEDTAARLELKAYTSQQIHALLQAEGVVEGSESDLPTDHSGHFVFYGYPPQVLYPEMFLEDQARYFLAQAGAIQPRRVAWLLLLQDRLPLAVLVQLDQPQVATAQQLFAACQEQKQTRMESIVADVKAAQALRSLYTAVSIQVLGTDAVLTQTLLQSLAAPFQQAYQPLSRRLPITCKAPVNSYPSLVLVADIVTQLKTGQTQPLADITALQQNHIQVARATVLKRLQTWQTRLPDLAQAIQATLRCLLKYQVLAEYRRTRYPLRGDDWAALEQYQQHDQAVKKAIYRLPLDEMSRWIDPLSLATLLAFLNGASNPHALQQGLQQQADQARAQMEAWQNHLQTQIDSAQQQAGSWGRFKHRASQGLYLVYQHSYLGLGEQLFSPLGQLAKTHVPSSVIEKTRWAIQKIARWGVLLTTASSSRAATSEQYVATHVTRDQLPRVFRGLGIATGAVATYVTGWYSGLRFLALGISGHSMGGWLTEPVLDDAAATAISSPYALGPAGVARLSSLGFTAIEASAQNSYAPLLLALGGMAGSGAGRRLAKKALPALDAKPDTVEQAQQQAAILFLFSLVGYEVGRWLMGQALQTVQGVRGKEAVRSAALVQLEAMATRGEIRYLQVQFPDLRRSPRFWFNAENPLHITGVDSSGRVIETDCEVRGLPDEVELTCQTQWATVPRLMGAL